MSLTPYNCLSLIPIRGRVTSLSADHFTTNNDQSYYLAEIELIEGAALYPGKPGEVMIFTGEQIVLEALFQSILQSLNRAFQESKTKRSRQLRGTKRVTILGTAKSIYSNTVPFTHLGNVQRPRSVAYEKS